MFNVDIATEDGPLRGILAAPLRPMRLMEIVATAAPLASEITDRAMAREKARGRTISCRDGCGACCRQWVPLSIPEVFWIRELVDDLPGARRAAMRRRFEKISAALRRRSGFVNRLLEPEPTAESTFPQAREYFALQLACPFLDRESCSIHEHRPMACRECNVTSPAGRCGHPYKTPVDHVALPFSLTVALGRMASALTGQPPRLVPLALAIEWAREHNELGRRTWPGPQLVQAFIQAF
ncbi:MAG: YkgJ family cysteine cluster protein [bacterium]|nr:YkgJ family cysteine cluster protein [bacterium]